MLRTGLLLLGTAALTALLATRGSTLPQDPTATVTTEDRVRAAVEKALPLVAERTGAWIDEHACTSCHQVPFGLGAMHRARKAGLAVDSRYEEWNRWAGDFVLRESRAEAPNTEVAEARTDELHQALEYGLAGDAPHFRALLAAARVEDAGHWEAQGQLPDQRRPVEETHAVTTLRTQFALGWSDRKAIHQALAMRSTSTEHLALKAVSFGYGVSAEALEMLLDAQNEDGGWGFLLGEPSDALGTSQALAALGGGRARHARDRAIAYLIDSQTDSGGWIVPSTLASKGREPHAVSNDWGTAWAAIALSERLLED